MIKLSIGRERNNKIIINHDKVSGHHAILTIKDDGTITILDDDSTNGTKINGKEIPKKVEVNIKRSDKILFAGEISLDWFQVPDIKYPTNIKKKITIGKGQGYDYQLREHDEISRDHAEILITDDNKLYLMDKSQKGTSVNGFKIDRYKFVQIKKGDKISFAEQDVFDWKKISAPSRINHWYVTIPVAVAVFAVGIFLLINYLIKPDPKIALYERYKNSVALVYNAYVYKVEIKNTTIFFDNNLNYYLDINKVQDPIRITGTAFFVSQDGKLITNRHVAMPWEFDKNGKDKLTKYLNNEFAKNPPSDLEGLVDIIQTLSSIKISGESVFIGIGLIDNHVSTNQGDFIPCQRLDAPSDQEIDLALIQTKDHRLPSQVENIFDCEDIIPTEKLIPGTQVHIMGYPFGLALASSPQGLKLNYQSGQISKAPDNYLFGFNAGSYHGSSGSPVFDEDGRLIGVCNSGIDAASGFSFGVIGKHAKELLHK